MLRILASLLLASAAPADAPPPATTFHFAPEPDANSDGVGDRDPAEWLDQPCDFHPNLTGVVALSRAEALVYGSLKTGFDRRSLLLSTTDGGATWSETLPPQRGHEAVEVTLVGRRQVFALTAWTVEALGELRVHETQDGGRTWRTIAEIDHRHYECWPVVMSFSDGRHGRIDVECPAGGDESGSWQFTTSDGGFHWRTHAWAPTSDAAEGDDNTRDPESTASDGTTWRATGSGTISRRLPGGEWIVVAVLPERLDRAVDGTPVPCASSR